VQGRLFQRHHDLLARLPSAMGGGKTIGDAIMAVFADPTQAFECALTIQQTLWDMRQRGAEEMSPQTKVCLHYGSALVETNDVYGDLVNMSARLSDMAEPDQILISQTVYECVKDRQDPPMLPLATRDWRAGEHGIPVYEVLWQQPGASASQPPHFRSFDRTYQACFYCGLQEHQVTQCPSKQLTSYTRRLNQLGYLPLPEILTLFQHEELNTVVLEQTRGSKIFEALSEIALPYQLRFLTKVWLATSEDWSGLERQQTTAVHPYLVHACGQGWIVCVLAATIRPDRSCCPLLTAIQETISRISCSV
jgi:hypothetical protein